jgi:hypothetical protein
MSIIPDAIETLSSLYIEILHVKEGTATTADIVQQSAGPVTVLL